MSSSEKSVPKRPPGIAKLQRDLVEKQFSAGIQSPLGGTESDAIDEVKKQMKGMESRPTTPRSVSSFKSTEAADGGQRRLSSAGYRHSRSAATGTR